MRLHLSAKISLLATLAILVTATSLGLLSVHDIRTQADAQISAYREEALARHTERVRNLVEVAYGAVRHHYQEWLRHAEDGASETAAQADALADLRTWRYADDGYFWVNDLYGLMQMHPYQTELEGTDVNNLQDPDGVYLFREFRRVCRERGEGLVAYRWPRPGTDRPVPKLSFVKLFKPWNWVIGSGVYVDDIDAAVAAEQEQVEARVRQTLGRTAGVAATLIAGSLLVVLVASRRFVSSPLRAARDLVRRLPADHETAAPRLPEPADEIGDLLAAINDMVGSWRRVGVELRDRQRFAENLIGGSAVAAFVLGPDHRVLLWNRSCEELTGLAAADVVGTREPWRAFYPDPTPTMANRILDDEFNGADSQYTVFRPSKLAADGRHGERWFHDLGGRERYLVFDAVPLHNAEGQVVAVLETLQDFAELKRTEEKLARLAAAVEQAAETIVVTDADGVITFANPAFETLTGYSRAQAVGESLHILRSRQYAPGQYEAMERALAEGHSWSGRLVSRRRDGSRFDEEASVSPVTGADGTLAGYVSVQRDVSRELVLEQQLRQAQKMEAVGTISGGIAHEFNNLLNAIMGFTEMTMEDAPPGSEARENLQHALDAAERGQQLVAQMATVGQQMEAENRDVVLPQVLREAVDLVKPDLPPGFEVRYGAVAETTRVWGDPAQLVQLFANLFTNAAQAMESAGGVAEVDAEAWRQEPGAPPACADLGPGAYWRVTVRDTGVGMGAAVLERIFEPFFTTRDVGEGTGLGLFVVHGIVRGLSGGITAHSVRGEGTTIELYLPCAPEPSAEDAPDAPLPMGSEHLLVVNPNPHEAEGLAQILGALGYRVECIGDAAAAAAAGAAPGGFDLALVEALLPGGEASTLAARLVAGPGETRTLLCAGYRGGDAAPAPPPGVIGTLYRPYSPAAVARVVRAALDA